MPADELKRTDTGNFNPGHFCFLVKTSRLGSELASMEVASVSCITEFHFDTFANFGYILDVPDQNIVGRFNQEVWSGRDKTIVGLPNLMARIARGGHYVYAAREGYTNYPTLGAVLDNRIPGKYNEIIVIMHGVRITGVFCRPALARQKVASLAKEAEERGIPLIKIGPQTARW